MSDEYTPLQDPEALGRAIRVTKLDVQPGEILHVAVGVSAQDMGDGYPAWLPSPDELEYVRSEFERALPDAKVLVTHMGIELSSHEAPAQVEIQDEEKLYGGSD